MDSQFLVVVLLIGLALCFDYINGFHDAANSIATVVSTRVLSPGQAVLWAAFFNFVAAFGFGTAVARTVGAGMIDLSAVTFTVIGAGILGAIVWDLDHLVLRPADQLFPRAVRRLRRSCGGEGRFRRHRAGWLDQDAHLHRRRAPHRVDRGAGADDERALAVPQQRPGAGGSLVPAAAAACRPPRFSLMHGANDAQKTMGIIAGVLFTAGYLTEFTIPFWVVIAAHLAIGLGTLSGGWRIIHTMGSKITKLQPVGGFAAETGAAVAIFLATMMGVGISTTHTITGAIVGVGATRRLSAVRWGVARQIMWAWILTIPASAFIGAVTYWALSVLELAGVG